MPEYVKTFIDLRSDTVTMPTAAMRQAMASAEVGDDGWRDDPTVNHLETVAAKMLSKEASVFVPSGTMANLASLLSHCQRGEEIIVGDKSHVYLYEYGGISVLGGVLCRQLPNEEDGTLDLDLLRDAIRPDSPRFPRTALVCLENTHNRCSGAVLTDTYTEKVCEIAHNTGAKVHLDGARLFNASVALGIDVKELTRSVDSVSFCFSKGLGCPVGSIICGDLEFVNRARRTRNMLGGGMRQAGILAAAALVGLTEMVDRLAEDHRLAKRLAIGLSGLKDITLKSVHTNIVMMQVDGIPTGELISTLNNLGVKVHNPYDSTIRMVTHNGINESDIDAVLEIMSSVIVN